MKKLFVSLLALSLLTGCQNTTEPDSSVQACDAVDACDDESNAPTSFTEISMDDAIAYFEEGKTGILYFGFDTCPYCQQAWPILEEVAQEQEKEIFYVKVRDENEELTYTDAQRETLTQYMSAYMSENPDQDNKLWLYVPIVLNVQDGQVKDGHVSVLEGYDPDDGDLTDAQKEQLKEIYSQLLQD